MTAPAKAAPMREDVTPGSRFRHLKRGTVYEIVGTAELQASQPQCEHAELAIYRGEDGKLWARNTGEFNDGRFERLAHTAHTARPDAVSMDAKADSMEAHPDAGDEDVERVARAIAGNHHKWDGLTEDGKESYLADARAALAAMREGVDRGMVQVPHEPTEAMLKAAKDAGNDYAFGDQITWDEIPVMWRAMVKAAAKDTIV